MEKMEGEEQHLAEYGSDNPPGDRISLAGTKKPLWKLYISRLLTAWGDRLWSFGLVLFLIHMRPDNLTLVAAYGFVKASIEILFLSAVGDWIDRTTRLRAAQILLIIQNVHVILGCVLLCVFFYYRPAILAQGNLDWLLILIIVFVFLAALIAALASNGAKIVIEKDWLVIIAYKDEERLAKLNSIFRTIDLSCLTLAPVLAGLMFSYVNYVVAAVVIGAWNIFSVILEYRLLLSIYLDYPELSGKTLLEDCSTEPGFGINCQLSKITGAYRGWVSYLRHDIAFAGLGLALLYMTVLGFDSITWSFILLQCVPEWTLGVLVAVSGGFGIAGSSAFPLLRRKLGVECSGVLGMGLLLASLLFCVVSIWLPGSPFDPHHVDALNTNFGLASNTTLDKYLHCRGGVEYTSVSVLLTGIICARFGLWVADLSVTQILQENVEEDKRGVIGGVQTSLNSTFDLLKFLFAFFLPGPQTFGILILLSFLFVFCGALSLFSYALRKRKLHCCQKVRFEAVNLSEGDNSAPVES